MNSAQLSNDLVYAAMAVYAVAMLAFAGAAAMTREVLVVRGIPAPAVSVGSVQSVSAGSTVLLEKPVALSPVSATGASGGSGSGRTAAWSRSAVALTILAAGLHLGAVVFRGVAAGRPPWGNMYEFAVAAALAATLVYLVALTKWPVRDAGIVIVPVVLLVLGIAVVKLYTEAEQLVPALRSYWLAIHVLAAIIAIGGFTLGAALSVLHLLVTRNDGAQLGPRLRRLPSAERLDRAAYRIHAFTFPLWTFAVLAGAVWAENAWGRPWNWDPKETWAFITWVVYASYLHARATAGWRGRRADMLALIGYATIIFNFTIINLYGTGLHTYSGVS